MSDLVNMLQTNKLDLVLLTLANACYKDQKKGSYYNFIRADAVRKLVEALPPIPIANDNDAEGYFKIEWGPGETGKNSNLAYLASYRKGKNNNTNNESPPEFFVVAIRGTDISADLDAKLAQLYEDFDATSVVDWQAHLNSFGDKLNQRKESVDFSLGNVAKGTANGFDRIVNMVDELNPANGTLIDTLWPLAGASDAPFKDVPIVVTGHSLGGGQTQVVASYLAWQLDGKGTSSNDGKISRVIPVAFAPPTAGDQQFASIYADWFPNNRYWMNRLDLVPQGFWNLIWTKKNLWSGKKYASDEHITWPDGSIWPAEKAEQVEQAELGKKSKDYSGKPGPGLPDALKFLVADKFLEAVEKLGYSRPDRGVIEINLDQVLPTPGHIKEILPYIKNPVGSLAMLQWQHFPPAYQEHIEKEHPDIVHYPLLTSDK